MHRKQANRGFQNEETPILGQLLPTASHTLGVNPPIP